MKTAEAVARRERAAKVRGSEHSHETRATARPNTTVRHGTGEEEPAAAAPAVVLRYLAPTRRCTPWMKVLFRMNMTAVAHHAHSRPPHRICAMSQTSRTSGCRRQNYQRMRDLGIPRLVNSASFAGEEAGPQGPSSRGGGSRGSYVYKTIKAWTMVKIILGFGQPSTLAKRSPTKPRQSLPRHQTEDAVRPREAHNGLFPTQSATDHVPVSSS